VKPRTVAILCGLLAVSIATVGCGRAGPTDGRPNVLLVVIDTLRADRLGIYGYPLETSPEIDALARGGVVFDRAIAAGPWTGPSHAAILTSRYSRRHSVGFRTGRTRLEGVTTVAEEFRLAGYKTAAFVSNYVLKRRFGWGHGFELFDDDFAETEPNRPNVPERIAEQTTERALDWLAAQGDDPFFLWVHFQDPHGPYAAPSGHRGRFRIPPEEGEAPLPVFPWNLPGVGIPKYQVFEDERMPSQYAARYADEILYVDRFVGKIVRAVERHPSGREALVLITSDHGESFGENEAYFVHGNATTPDIAHVPMILRGPELPPGRRAELVSHVDVTPTLLELAGLGNVPDPDGIALGPCLRERCPLPDRFVYCDRGKELGAYRGDGFLRVKGLLKGKESPDPAARARWTRHPWPEGDWQHVGLEAEADPEVARYLATLPETRKVELDGETEDSLRRLGYLD
jgi:arylsulfatase A-like enzyme